MESEEIEIVNPDEKDYYDGRLFRVCVWCGNGYVLNQYLVYGNDNAEAILENVVAYAEENEPEILIDVDDVYSEIDEIYLDEYNQYIEDNPEGDKDTFISDYLGYIYIDATMEGANQPYYIRTENLRIEEVGIKKGRNKIMAKKLQEEVSDEMYDIAETIAVRIKERQENRITMEELQELIDDAAEEIGVAYEEDDFDFEAQIRGILSYMGFGTDFETGELILAEESKTEGKKKLSPEDEAHFNDEIDKIARQEVEDKLKDGKQEPDEEIEKELDNIKENKSKKTEDKGYTQNQIKVLSEIDVSTFEELQEEIERLLEEEVIDDDEYEIFSDIVSDRAEKCEKYIEDRSKVTNTDYEDIVGIESDYVVGALEEIIDSVKAVLGESKKITESKGDYAEMLSFAAQLASALKSKGFQVKVNGEDNYVNINPKRNGAEMGVAVYLGEEDGQYGFEVTTVGLGGDTISDETVYPIYEESWDGETASPRGRAEAGKEVYAMFKEISNVTPEEVAVIVEKSFDTRGPVDESKKVTEGKKTESKRDMYTEFTNYCTDLGLDPNKKSSLNKFLGDYAKNYTSMNGIASFDTEMTRVEKEIKTGLKSNKQ